MDESYNRHVCYYNFSCLQQNRSEISCRDFFSRKTLEILDFAEHKNFTYAFLALTSSYYYFNILKTN